MNRHAPDADCPSCGHPKVAHEPAVRVGKAWFTIQLAAEQGELNAAQDEGKVFMWCGHCEDGCPLCGQPSCP